MIKSVRIKNFKSIQDLHLELGRINIFIGENGAGKSNILEAIALAGAAHAGKLDNEFLVSRGIRVTDPKFMTTAFNRKSHANSIEVSFKDEDASELIFTMSHSKGPYADWSTKISFKGNNNAEDEKIKKNLAQEMALLSPTDIEKLQSIIGQALEIRNREVENNLIEKDAPLPISFKTIGTSDEDVGEKISAQAAHVMLNVAYTINGIDLTHVNKLKDFIIYSPENSSLRVLEREGQIQPLGVNGEGLLKLLTVISNEESQDRIQKIKHCLEILGWFVDFRIPHQKSGSPERIEIQDIFLEKAKTYLDQKSSNEGFLFLAFYFSLFCSNLTPKIFAIDNIDASLNPKLCEDLIAQLVKLSADFDKQAIMTTHNPAILDGLDLNDKNQKLFVIYRGFNGQTLARPVQKKDSRKEFETMRLSEMFMRGLIGGLSKAI